MDASKAKINADLLILAIFALKQMKIQIKNTLNNYKYDFTCKCKLSLHILRDNIY